MGINKTNIDNLRQLKVGQYDAGKPYTAGELVSFTDIVYVAVNPSLGGGDPSTNPTDWKKSSSAAGKLYSTTELYEVGDLVTRGGITYECVTAVTIPEAFQTAKWNSNEERGGMIYSTTKSYKVGDIVTEDASLTSKVWRCIADTNGAFAPASWAALSEQGGTEWKAAFSYTKGDIVARSDIAPSKVFVSLADTNLGNQPPALGSNSSWQELATAFYNAETGGDLNGDGILDATDGGNGVDGGGQHCPWLATSGDPIDAPVTPNTRGEYPETGGGGTGIPETIGASWIVSGLGYAQTGDKIQYLMTTGNLSGLRVRDGDLLSWADGAQGSEIWFHSPVPEVIGERGGLQWRSAKSYIIGDVVGESGKQYTSLTNGNQGNIPSNQLVNSGFWSIAEEGGGLVYDQYKTYDKRAIVSIDESYPSGITVVEQYLSQLDTNKGNNPTADNGTNWKKYEVVKYTPVDLTFTVHHGGAADFPSLNAALQFLGRYQSADGSTLNIVILDGCIDTVQVYAENADYSGIVVKNESTGNPYISDVSVAAPNQYNMIFVNSKSPRFDTDFEMTTRGLGGTIAAKQNSIFYSKNIRVVIENDTSNLDPGFVYPIQIGINCEFICPASTFTMSALMPSEPAGFLIATNAKIALQYTYLYIKRSISYTVLTAGQLSTVYWSGAGVGTPCIIPSGTAAVVGGLGDRIFTIGYASIGYFLSHDLVTADDFTTTGIAYYAYVGSTIHKSTSSGVADPTPNTLSNRGIIYQT